MTALPTTGPLAPRPWAGELRTDTSHGRKHCRSLPVLRSKFNWSRMSKKISKIPESCFSAYKTHCRIENTLKIFHRIRSANFKLKNIPTCIKYSYTSKIKTSCGCAGPPLSPVRAEESRGTSSAHSSAQGSQRTARPPGLVRWLRGDRAHDPSHRDTSIPKAALPGEPRWPARRPAALPQWAAASLVEDLHAEGFLVLVLVVVDVNQDLLLARILARGEAQADGVHLPTGNLRDNRHEERWQDPAGTPRPAHPLQASAAFVW